ncbi:hypothetical protein [Azospirillum thermophilum]|uniref:DUF3299 domain-containing protein n=1 Tax=Azospirillum thermophilum TaxID=2202148 RepID=A0A2S2CV38_9PROT|nr:hypothetical protein [Azospirillum thermophilum]AWK88348.1 hypothetical protein DEW08_19860 [Azospirillum thermophilum]
MIGRRAVLGGLAVPLLAALPAGGAGAAEGARLRFDDLYVGDGILGMEFSPRTKELAGRRVTMRGYMAPPLKAEASFFVLTRNPVDLCPFCNSDADWPVDIVVVYPGREAEFVRNSVPIDVSGTLQVGPYRDPASGFHSRLRLTDAAFRALN